MIARFLVSLVVLAGCKGGDDRQAAPPRVSTLTALPPAPPATLAPADAVGGFPREAPAIVLFQGGGDPPRTIVGIRVWPDGSVRFRCNRRGTLPPERVTAMLDAFERAGWLAAPTSPTTNDTDPACIKMSVQVSRDTRLGRRDAACEQRDDSIADAFAFVQAVVGPDPCP